MKYYKDTVLFQPQIDALQHKAECSNITSHNPMSVTDEVIKVTGKSSEF